MPKQTAKDDPCKITLMFEGQVATTDVTFVAEAFREALETLLRKLGVGPCAVYQALIHDLIDQMVEHGHVGCAAVLVDDIAAQLAPLVRPDQLDG